MMAQHPPSSAPPPPHTSAPSFWLYTTFYLQILCNSQTWKKVHNLLIPKNNCSYVCVWSGVNRDIHFLPFSLHHQTLNFHPTLPPSLCQSVCLPCLPTSLPSVVSQQNLGRTQCCKHRERHRETKTTAHTKKNSCVKTPYQSFSFPQNQYPSFRGRRRRVRFLE